MANHRSNFAGAEETHLPFEHFFKVISPETVRHKKLMLPEKFGGTFKGKLPTVAMLKVPNGRVWRVGLTRERGNRNRVWLDSGFGDFLSFHSITAQHLLMFKYDGHSIFKVIICDTTACEVVFQNPEPRTSFGEEGNDVDEPSEEEEEISESDSEEDNDMDEPSEEEEEISESDSEEGFGIKSGKGNGHASGSRGHASGSRRRGRATGNRASGMEFGERDRELWKRLVDSKIAVTIKFKNGMKDLSAGSKRAVEKAISSKPRNPSAIVVLKKFHIHPGIMYLPTKFANKYFPKDSEEITLRFYDEKSGCWGALQIHGSRNKKKVWLLGKWGGFCSINDLIEGDVCLLELIDEQKKILNVHIFKA